MNRVQKSLVLTVFTMAITSIFLLTIGNQAFAVEYSNYTSEKYGIQFEYPSTWDLTEKTSRFDEGPLLRISNPTILSAISIDYHDNIPKSMPLKEALELMLEVGTSDLSTETKIIETPSILTIDNQTAGTYVLTMKPKFEVDAKKTASQSWWVTTSNRDYRIIYTSNPEDFDSSENIEVRDHFVKSIKFLGDKTSTKTTSNSTSRFD